MRSLPALLLLLLASCDSGMEIKEKEYSEWQTRNFAIEHVARATPATEAATITLDVAGYAKAPEDWIELNVNGVKIARTPIWSAPGKPPVSCRFALKIAPHMLNWIRFFSSVEKKGWGFQVEARLGKTFAFQRGGDDGWTMTQSE